MTAIAYRDGVMVADTVGWTASSSVKMPVPPKIRRGLGGCLFAAAGDRSDIEQFAEWMLHNKEPTPPFVKDDDFTGIIARGDGSLWLCSWKLAPYQLDVPFFAIGAPSLFMLGALYQGATAEEAVRLAILHTDGAGGDVQVEHLDLVLAEAAE